MNAIVDCEPILRDGVSRDVRPGQPVKLGIEAEDLNDTNAWRE